MEHGKKHLNILSLSFHVTTPQVYHLRDLLHSHAPTGLQPKQAPTVLTHLDMTYYRQCCIYVTSAFWFTLTQVFRFLSLFSPLLKYNVQAFILNSPFAAKSVMFLNYL